MKIIEMTDEPFEKILANKADLMKIPITATFEISPICNMDCEMCYICQKKKEVDENGGLLDIDFWVDIAKQAMSKGTLFLLITGGEPFLYKNFKELYLKLHSLGVYICINTNATLIDEDTILWLKENPPRRLNISLYGGSNETYNRLCKNPNGFTQVTKAMKLLKESNIMFRINSVLTPLNVDDYYDIINIAENLQVPLAFSYYMYPPIRKNIPVYGENNHRLTAQKAGEMAFIYNRDKRNKDEFDELMDDIENSLYNKRVSSCNECDSISCRAGSSSFWVNWKGEMLSCGVMEYPKIDLKSTTLDKAWEYIKEETDKIRMPKACATCNIKEYCNVCAAIAYSETGSFDGTPDYLCQLTEEYVSRLTEEYNRRKKCEND